MKRVAIFSFTLICVMMFGAANAQTNKTETKKEIRIEKKNERKVMRKLEGTLTSEFVKKAFYTDFGNIPEVTFTRRDFMDEATFKKDGLETTAYYDYSGTLVGTTTLVPFSKVPKEGQDRIKKLYPGYTVGNVLFYDDNEANDMDMMLYSVQFDDEDNYFVELSKGDKNLVVQVNPEGEVFFFKQL